MQLIAVLGEKDAGRKAISKALAGKQGFSSEYDIERLLDGSSDGKLQVPTYMRGTLADIGLATALAPLNIFEIVAGEEPLLMAEDSWQDLEFEVALDSGAVVHVCSLEDCPWHALHESPGSKAGQVFILRDDGGTIKNLCKHALNLSDAWNGTRARSSRSQPSDGRS